MDSDILKKDTLIKSPRFISSLIITIFLVFGSILRFFDIKLLLYIGTISILIGFGLGCLYGLIIKNLSLIERIIIILISLIPLLRYIFTIQHWKGVMIFQYALFIPIGLFVFICFRMTGKLKYEFPFLGIIALFALLTFIGG